jgi:hypothetical protein
MQLSQLVLSLSRDETDDGRLCGSQGSPSPLRGGRGGGLEALTCSCRSECLASPGMRLMMGGSAVRKDLPPPCGEGGEGVSKR